MGIVYFIAAGGLSLWFIMTWAFTKLLRVTGTEAGSGEPTAEVDDRRLDGGCRPVEDRPVRRAQPVERPAPHERECLPPRPDVVGFL